RTPAPAAAQPGAWPGAASPAAAAQSPAPAAQAPAAGAWPSATAPGSGAPAPAPAPAAAAPTGPAPAIPSPGMAAGAGQVQAMWPAVLEAVKNRRRFTWILLSQNAQVTGFDGTTLQLGFPNVGARDNFASSGSEDVLKAVLAEQFQVNWKIDAVVGGGAPVPAMGSYSAPAAPAYSPPPPQQQAPAPQQPSQPASYQQPSQQSAPPPQPPERQAPPPVSPEDDVPEEDDPDLVDSALTGHDLIVRELGATVVEEYTNE
ncbi:DNA polymerase III subunit gamma and tau, partial [Streptomyces sp. NPDC060333]